MMPDGAKCDDAKQVAAANMQYSLLFGNGLAGMPLEHGWPSSSGTPWQISNVRQSFDASRM